MGAHTKTAKTFRLTAEELALLDAARDRTGGSYTDAIASALRVYVEGQKITQADVVTWIKANTSNSIPLSRKAKVTG